VRVVTPYTLYAGDTNALTPYSRLQKEYRERHLGAWGPGHAAARPDGSYLVFGLFSVTRFFCLSWLTALLALLPRLRTIVNEHSTFPRCGEAHFIDFLPTHCPSSSLHASVQLVAARNWRSTILVGPSSVRLTPSDTLLSNRDSSRDRFSPIAQLAGWLLLSFNHDRSLHKATTNTSPVS